MLEVKVVEGSVEKLCCEEIKNSCQFMDDKDSISFFMYKEGEEVAYASIKKESDKYFLREIYVVKSERFKSNGTKLMKQIFTYLAENNCDKFFVEKNITNGYFLKRTGFEIKNNLFEIDGLLDSKKRQNEGMFGTVVSIVVNVFLSVIKIVFGIYGKSRALVADGFHSISDVITSIVVLVSIKLASKPADEDHPYGHGQIESISGNMIGLILIITALELIRDNITSIFKNEVKVMPKTLTLYIVIAAIVIKAILYIYKIRMGRRLKNEAIIADAKDHKSDVISSIGVLIGIILAIKIHPIFDMITGIIVGLIIGKEGFEIVFHTSNKIMDIQEKDFIEDVKEMIKQDPEVYNVHDIYMKNSGEKIFLSFHVRVDGDMTVKDSHRIVDRLMDKIKGKHSHIENMVIHVDPFRKEKVTSDK